MKRRTRHTLFEARQLINRRARNTTEKGRGWRNAELYNNGTACRGIICTSSAVRSGNVIFRFYNKIYRRPVSSSHPPSRANIVIRRHNRNDENVVFKIYTINYHAHVRSGQARDNLRGEYLCFFFNNNLESALCVIRKIQLSFYYAIIWRFIF